MIHHAHKVEINSPHVVAIFGFYLILGLILVTAVVSICERITEIHEKRIEMQHNARIFQHDTEIFQAAEEARSDFR